MTAGERTHVVVVIDVRTGETRTVPMSRGGFRRYASVVAGHVHQLGAHQVPAEVVDLARHLVTLDAGATRDNDSRHDATRDVVAADPGRVARHDRSMSPHEVAARLGKHVETIRRWIRDGDLKAAKAGRSWLVAPADLADFLTDNPQDAAA